jgi:hypothetical protein
MDEPPRKTAETLSMLALIALAYLMLHYLPAAALVQVP